MRGWRTVAGEPAPKTPPATRAEQFTALKSLGPYLWPKGEGRLKLRVVCALSLVMIGKLFNVGAPLVLRQVVNTLGRHPTVAMLTVPIVLVVAYGVARICSQASGELRDLVFAPVLQQAVRKVSIEVLDRLHGLSLRFHLDRQTGGISRIIDRGSSAVEILLGLTLMTVAPILLEVALVSGVLLRLFSPGFALTTIAIIVGYGAFTFAVTKRRVELRREMNQQDNQANSIAIDSLINYETVKYFGAERHEIGRYDTAKRNYQALAIRNQSTLSMLNIGQNLIMTTGLVTILTMAVLGVVHGKMSVGDFVLVNAYMLQLFIPLNMLGTMYRSLKQSLVDYEQMHRLITTSAEVQDRPGAGSLRDPEGEIVFSDVAFSYDGRRPILAGVSFRVPPGRKVALVGPSGAGKSTIARLMFRFYDVTAGAITVGGQDIREVSQAGLRQVIGVVPQDTVLFNETLYYNIAYGRPDATREEVVEAARLAQLDRFISNLPDGYETTVGERGLKLSGGEKQRVAIARVILKQPKILIFDEATSALDSQTEQAIQESLRDLAIGHTSLVIAHRLSTITDADEILVVEAGRIVERGDHQGLLHHDGLYAAMWARQQAGDDDALRGSNDAEPRPARRLDLAH